MTGELGRRRGFGARGLAVAAITAFGISTAGVLHAGPALAAPVKQTLNLTCDFPEIGDQPVTVDFESDFPQVIRVGEATPPKPQKVMHLNPTKADGTDVWTGGKDVACTKLPGRDAPVSTSNIEPPTPAPTPPPVCQPSVDYVRYSVNGETFIKASNGKTPLTGTAETVIICDERKGINLQLNPTEGDFRLFGFLPVTADMQLTPQHQTTSQSGSGVTINSEVTTELTSIKAFGSIPIGGGETCQTDIPSDLTLTSPHFDTFAGGKFTGEYELSSISDCGLLTPIFSGFIAGGGNTIELDLIRHN